MLQQIAISALVVSMMLAIGLRTDPADFAVVFQHRRAVGIGLLVNLLGAPALALALTALIPLPQAVTTGLFICAACPGGPVGALFALLAGGHPAAAVATMGLLSLVSVATAPLTLDLALASGGARIEGLVVPLIVSLTVYQLLPLLAGMAIRRTRPALAVRVAGPANRAANILLLGVIVGLLATKWSALASVGWPGVGASIAIVVALLGIGALCAPAGPMRRSLTMITGVRNISLALLISALYFPDPLTDASILTFGLFTMLLPALLARAWRRKRIL